MILKLIYTLFIGILLAVFVGMGIEAFYPQPKAPEFPTFNPYRSGPQLANTPAPEDAQKAEAYDQQQKDYQAKIKPYNRNVSLIILGVAIVILIIALGLAQKLHDLADGVLLGGVFTLIYGIGRAFIVDDDKYRFLIVTIGLIIGFILGYLKFVKPQKKPN